MKKYLAVHNQKPLGLCDRLEDAQALCDERLNALNKPFEYEGETIQPEPLSAEEWHETGENDVKFWHRNLLRAMASGYWADSQCVYVIE